MHGRIFSNYSLVGEVGWHPIPRAGCSVDNYDECTEIMLVTTCWVANSVKPAGEGDHFPYGC